MESLAPAQSPSPPLSSASLQSSEEEGTGEIWIPMNGEYAEPAEEEQVMSEVHLGCPPGLSGPHISHFTVSLPPCRYADASEDEDEDGVASLNQTIGVDEDGDLVLTRREGTFLVHAFLE